MAVITFEYAPENNTYGETSIISIWKHMTNYAQFI